MKVGDIYIPVYIGEFEMELISISPIKIKCVKTDKDKGFKINEVVDFKENSELFNKIWKKKI